MAAFTASLALVARHALGVSQADPSTLSLVQTRADVKSRSGATSRASQECGYLIDGRSDPVTAGHNNQRFHSHGADFGRSIVDVMREHPGVDGYCHFNDAAFYIHYLPDPRNYVELSRQTVIWVAPAWFSELTKSAASPPNVTFRWEGPPVRTQVARAHYIYDDLYAYAMGFLQGQGLETALMFNSTAWEELSAQKCAEIQQEYHFRDDELIFNDLLNHNLPILVESACAAGIDAGPMLGPPHTRGRSGYNGPDDCRTVTRREFAAHHYMKCALGHKNSALDMAYLHSRACLLEGGRVGHGEECPFNLLA